MEDGNSILSGRNVGMDAALKKHTGEKGNYGRFGMGIGGNMKIPVGIAKI